MSSIGHNQNYVSINSLSDEDKNKLRGAIQSLNDSMTRAAAEKDFQKEAINEVADATGVDKKIIRRMAKVYFRANYSQEQEDNRQFEEFYDGVMK
jgi:predicted solute-binding protein